MNYALSVSSSRIELQYRSSAAAAVETFAVAGGNLALDHAHWHHITVTVFEEDAAIYVNGSLVGVMALVGPVLDDTSRDVKLGQIASGEPQEEAATIDVVF